MEDRIEDRITELEKRAGLVEERLDEAINARIYRRLELVDSNPDAGSLGNHYGKAIYRIESPLREDTLDDLRRDYDTVTIRPAEENDNMDHATVVATLSYERVVDPEL